jgi:hypothetical protein
MIGDLDMGNCSRFSKTFGLEVPEAKKTPVMELTE